MIKQEFLKFRKDGVALWKTYSDKVPTIKQLPTGIVYDCWVYKLDENGNQTNEVDWEASGVVDVYPIRYTYIESTKEIENQGE